MNIDNRQNMIIDKINFQEDTKGSFKGSDIVEIAKIIVPATMFTLLVFGAFKHGYVAECQWSGFEFTFRPQSDLS